ncbi:hypothetical protein ACWD6R_37660 [Streptomyces sp. NPDC005151]
MPHQQKSRLRTNQVTNTPPARASRVGVYCVGTWNRERRLLRHGVTVVASQANRPGAYLYTDNTGTTRVLSHMGFEPFVRASYDPRDPSDVLVPQAPFMRRFNAFVLFCGLNGAGLAIWMTVMAVLDEEL